MTNGIELTSSEIKMLNYVVELYIRTGVPVSSRMIKRFYHLKDSTANIRKMLHSLEERRFLYKPHISAGRVPADRGYRQYVDGIKTVSPLGGIMVESIRVKIGQDWNDVRDLMSRTSRLLSELTNYMGLIMGLFVEGSIVKRLRLIQLDGGKGLLLLSLYPRNERRVYVELPKKYPVRVVERAMQIINERLAGYPLEEAPARLAGFLKDGAGLEREIAEVVYRETEYLFDWPFNLSYCFLGLERKPELLELSDPRILQNLVRIMGEQHLMLNAMKRRLGDETTITIGRENEMDELNDFSLVTRKFHIDDYDGLLGILGPTRMEYSRVLSLLAGMAEELQQLEIKGR
jgi:heat-inducible transcriptional repressor